ncbi:MAG: RDD family protein [Actinomycetota bacterium]|nr:RDD family protein [Actinomycetota bacterium]
MKRCPSCGAENPDDAAFCSGCAYSFGTPPPGGQAYPPPGGQAYPPPGGQAYPPPPGGQAYPPPPGWQAYPPGHQYPQPGYPRYAGFWIRFVAAFIDGIIVSVAFLPLNLIFSALSDRFYFWGSWDWREGVSVGLVILFNLIRIGVGWAYYTVMTGRYGATLGKMLLKLKVVGEDMGPVSYGTAALREIVGKFLSGLVCALGYIWAGFDDRKQAWHDKIAHTFVIITGP